MAKRAPYEAVLRRLGELPTGARLYWSDDAMSSTRRWSASWSDVVCEPLCTELGVDFVWTVRAPEAAEQDPLCIPLEPEFNLWQLFPSGGSFVLLPVGAELEEQEEAMLLAASSGSDEIVGSPAWSSAGVQAAVQAWLDRNVGPGRLVLTFEPDLYSPAARLLMEKLPALAAEEMAVLADGVLVPRSIYDHLMTLPLEQRSGLISDLQHAAEGRPPQAS